MAVTPQTVEELVQTGERTGWVAAVVDFARQRPLGAIGAVIILVMVTMAAMAGPLAPYNPLENDYGAMLAAPGVDHWLGTDAHGRDMTWGELDRPRAKRPRASIEPPTSDDCRATWIRAGR